jgi:thymidylate synthase (FAD)
MGANVSEEIRVLDHGYVRLENWMGDDEAVLRAARVSYDRDDHHERCSMTERDEKLIHYLMKNKHTSPFEHVIFTFEVKAPIFVFRQWHRHRTWSFNEVSARYTELPEEFYVPDVSQITTQSVANKQQRTNEQHPHASSFQRLMGHAMKHAFDIYKWMLEEGCPRELARTVLPVATYSRMYATVDLHNLFHFLRLRDHDHAQYEVRVYAQAMRKLIESIVPVSVKAFQETAE